MRPVGEARQALMRVLDAGVAGTFDVLAATAMVPQERARCILWSMKREGLVRGWPMPAPATGYARGRGRPRVVYAKPPAPALELSVVMCSAWR